MSEELYPAGARVIERRGYVPGTSQGRAQFQNYNRSMPQIYIIFDDGRKDSIPESFLREMTAEDLERYEERRRRTEEANEYQRAKRERIQQRQKAAEEARRRQRAEALEAKEEARRQADIKHTNEMREANARIYGLRSLKEAAQ